MHENGERYQYARPRPSGLSPFAKRILIMLAVFALLLPLANVLKGSNGNIVQTTGLPGGAVSGGPLTAVTTTTVAPVADPSAAAAPDPSPSGSADTTAAAPDTTAAAPITQAAPQRKAATPSTAAKKAPATTAKPKVTAPPTTAKPKVKVTTPPTTAKPKAPVTTAPKPAPAPAPVTAPPNTYTREQIEAIIRQVWPDDLEDRALAIAQRESHLIPTSHNYCCYGLFAIYYEAGKRLLNSIGITSPQQLFDPMTNTRAALAIYQVAGWDPWKL